MFKKLVLMAVFVFAATHLMSQDKKFSVQLNTGYTFFSGTKLTAGSFTSNEQPKMAYGSFINGQIPIEVEFRYRVIPQFAINFAYGYGIGLPYSSDVSIEGISAKFKNNLSTHGLSLGGLYYFTTDKFRPYVGLDVQVLLSNLSIKTTIPAIDETTGEPSATQELAIKSKTFANFGLSPKVGFEYNFTDKIYLNAAVHYQLIVPSKINMKDGREPMLTQDQTVTNGIGVKVGVGFRF